MDPGENLEQAVAREVYEETGLQALNLDYRMRRCMALPALAHDLLPGNGR